MTGGIGIDVISIPRIERFMERYGEKALLKYLSKDEMKLVKTPKTAAGFWSVKEAVSKALGCGIGEELSFFDIKISKTLKGAPVVSLSKEAKKLHDVKNVAVSITHDGGIAIAVATVEC